MVDESLREALVKATEEYDEMNRIRVGSSEAEPSSSFQWTSLVGQSRDRWIEAKYDSAERKWRAKLRTTRPASASAAPSTSSAEGGIDRFCLCEFDAKRNPSGDRKAATQTAIAGAGREFERRRRQSR